MRLSRPQGDGLGRRIANTAPWTPGAGSYNPGARPSGEPEGRPSSGLHPEAVLFPDSVHWPANLPPQEETRDWIKNGVVYVWNGTAYASSTTEQPSDNEEPEDVPEPEDEGTTTEQPSDNEEPEDVPEPEEEGSGEEDDEDVEEENGDEDIEDDDKENAEDNLSGEDFDNEEVDDNGEDDESEDKDKIDLSEEDYDNEGCGAEEDYENMDRENNNKEEGEDDYENEEDYEESLPIPPVSPVNGRSSIASPLSGSSMKSVCRTTSGPAAGKRCVFPFTWKGRTYHSCTREGDQYGHLWCSTSTDTGGNHVSGQGEYGVCSKACRAGRP